MLREILSALVSSGDTALRSVAVVPEQVAVKPLRAQRLTLPRLAYLRIDKGRVGRIYVGAEALGTASLASADPTRSARVFANVCAELLTTLLAALSHPRDRGSVQPLDARRSHIVTRGQRTYGIDYVCGAGSLRIVAELAGRGEYEAARGSDFANCLVNAALPRTSRASCELTGAGLTGALRCLAELETDLELEVALPGDAVAVYTGLLWPHAAVASAGLLPVVATPPRDADPLSSGTAVTGHCSIGGRAYQFTTAYTGAGGIELPAGASLPCLLLTRPTRLVAEQRRCSFRIEPRETVRAQLGACGRRPAGDRDRDVAVEVADLSFSGARLVAPLDTLRNWLAPGDCVSCRLQIPGRAGRLVVRGEVRRVTAVLSGRANWQDDVGIEFAVRGDEDRAGLAGIRDYVLAEQRALLANRVQLPQR